MPNARCLDAKDGKCSKVIWDVYHIYRLHFDCKTSLFHLDMDDDFDDDGDDDDDDGATSEFPLNFNLLPRPEKANPLNPWWSTEIHGKLSTLGFLPTGF